MKTIRLNRKTGLNRMLAMLILMLLPLWASAQQYWESGTTKTNSFTSEKQEVWYDINAESDGRMEFGSTPLNDAVVTGITLYAVDGDEIIWVAGGSQALIVEDVAAGLYRVKINGRPINNKWTGNFLASYVLIPADYVNDPEPNDTWERAYQIESGNPQHGHLGYKRGNYRDTEDWFKIVLPDEGTVTLTTTTSTKLKLGWVGMYTVNEEGTGVNFRNDKWMSGEGKDTTITYVVPDCAAGTYYVRVRRDNGYGGYKMNYTFTPNAYGADVKDNNTWDKAINLALDTPRDGRLGYHFNGDTDGEDWYKIVVPEEGKLTILTKSEPTLRLGWVGMYTLNAEGTGTVFRNDKWMSGEGKDTTVVYEVPDVSIGTYYVRVRRDGGYGGYTLTCYFTSHAAEADPEPNNVWNDPEVTLLKSGPALTGQLGYVYNGDTDNEDWYKIEVPKEGSVVLSTKTETTLSLGWVGMYTLNAEGTGTVYRNDKWMSGEGKDTTIVYTVPDCAPGTYYIRVRRNGGYGTYTLQYIHNPNIHENDPEINNTWDKATLIGNGDTQQGCMGYHYNGNTDTEDWFMIELPDEGMVTLATTTETTLKFGWVGMYTPNAEGTGTVYRNDKWMSGEGQDTTVVYTIPDCAPGIYYIRVQRYQGYGGYKLDYTFTPNSHAQDNLDNDTWDKATFIENKTTQEGRFGYHYNGNTDGEDWFYIEVPDEGTVTLSTTTEPTLRFGWVGMYTLNAEGTGTVYRNDKWMSGEGKDTTIVYTVPDCAPGTYYIRVRRDGGYGGYKIDYNFTPNIYGPDFADNGSWDKASTIETGSTQQGRLGYYHNGDTDTEDWYEIDVPYVGNITLSTTTETTLRLGWVGLYLPNAEGTGTEYRTDKWMNGEGKDTTIVFNINGVGAGKYFIRLRRDGGYGGYALKYDFERNPFDRDNLQNGSFATRYHLEEGKLVSTTMGYRYREQNNEDWYDLGMMHGRQIDVTVSPDTTHTLIIGVPALYIYKGDREDGSPILQNVAEKRLERSQGTISYLDKNETDQHYVFRVPNYNGSSYGGYTIIFGDEQQEGETQLANSISVMTEGRNTVRKGVPCENPITITNMSSTKSGSFLVSIVASDNVDMIGFRMNSSQYIPISEATEMDGGDCEHTAVFYVPSLNPWESYTFTMISEGKGDIAYAPQRQVFHNGPNKIVISGTTFAVVAVLGYVADAVIGDKIDDFINDQVSAVFELDATEQEQYAQCMGITRQQLEIEKQQTGIAAYTVKSVVKKTMTTVIEALPGGKIATKVGGLLETMQNIVPSIRRRIWYWIYKDLGYIQDEPDIMAGTAAITDVVASWDPNEMVGPAGVGDEHYIGETQTINYRILFENKAEAGDAAYRVRVSDELDENIFDVSTARFGETSHDGVGYNWVMTREGNKLSWDIQGIELPPNVNAPEGEGFVSFSVDLKPNLPNGTQIKNKATIIFDKNFPIETNEFVNTLDLEAPVTTKAEAQWKVDKSAVRINCQSDDNGSGVSNYLLFVSTNGGDFIYKGQYQDRFIEFTPDGGTDAVYDLCVFVVDNVGNTERVVPTIVETVTGIQVVSSGLLSPTVKVYTLDGRYVGNSLKNLPQGIYVIDGQKYVVK